MSAMVPSFQAFLNEYREPVYRFLVASVGPIDADDCFQETFLSALRGYSRLVNASNLRAWIFTIAHRKALDQHRRRSRRLRTPDESNSAPDSAEDSAVWDAVRRLPPKQRATIFHRYAGGLSYKEIGVVVGCSEAAARRSVHEGVKKLREVWS